VLKAVEIKAEKVRMAETEGGREKRRKKRKKEKETQKNRSAEDSKRMGDLG